MFDVTFRSRNKENETVKLNHRVELKSLKSEHQEFIL